MTPAATPQSNRAAATGARTRCDDLPTAEAVMRRAGAENFRVASRLLPRQSRRHLLALYGFARLVDDTGDEATGDRLALLDLLDAEIDLIYTGGAPRHPLMAALTPTVRACDIPDGLLRDLVEANRRDQSRTSYATYADLLDYCSLSANPVGRLVLHAFGAATPDRCQLADSICTALQIAEHLQDVAEDHARGRVYLPAEDMRRFGCTPADLSAPRASERLRELIAFEVDRARALLHRGAPLVNTIGGRPAIAVAGFVSGGHAALAAIEQARFDVLAQLPRARRRDRARALCAVLVAARRERYRTRRSHSPDHPRRERTRG